MSTFVTSLIRTIVLWASARSPRAPPDRVACRHRPSPPWRRPSLWVSAPPTTPVVRWLSSAGRPPGGSSVPPCNRCTPGPASPARRSRPRSPPSRWTQPRRRGVRTPLPRRVSSVDEYDRTANDHITSLHQQVSALTRVNEALTREVGTLLRALASVRGVNLGVVAFEHLGRRRRTPHDSDISEHATLTRKAPTSQCADGGLPRRLSPARAGRRRRRGRRGGRCGRSACTPARWPRRCGP